MVIKAQASYNLARSTMKAQLIVLTVKCVVLCSCHPHSGCGQLAESACEHVCTSLLRGVEFYCDPGKIEYPVASQNT